MPSLKLVKGFKLVRDIISSHKDAIKPCDRPSIISDNIHKARNTYTCGTMTSITGFIYVHVIVL